jgi:glyoxalase family protein
MIMATTENTQTTQLHGLHHVTAVSGNMGSNLNFYTRILGLRLVKKTVNQDDTSAYHMYYADKLGTPGTDITFFDWPQAIKERRGSDSVVTTMFRVNGRAAFDYWLARFAEHDVAHGEIETMFGRELVRFEDREGQRLALVDDGGAAYEGELWDGAGVPADVAVRGFYGVTLSIPHLSQLTPILTEVLGFAEVTRTVNASNETVVMYGLDGGGPGKEVHVIEQPNLAPARQGRGGIHHVAFRVPDDAMQRAWRQRLTSYGLRVSDFIDRFYFHSIYFRISNGILFEIATDGPGFTGDEPLETLGETLALPPFLETHRAQIEAGLTPIPVLP